MLTSPQNQYGGNMLLDLTVKATFSIYSHDSEDSIGIDTGVTMETSARSPCLTAAWKVRQAPLLSQLYQRQSSFFPKSLLHCHLESLSTQPIIPPPVISFHQV
jgi:hypothetical protein